MTSRRLAAARVLVGDRLVGPAEVVVDDHEIAAIEPLDDERGVPDRTLAPGFIDIQVNGIGPVDVARATGRDWDDLDIALLAQGTTTWCPTVVTAPLDAYARPLAEIAAAAARAGARPAIAGAHLEGPFLGGAPGAHRRELVIPVDDAWLRALPPIVRLVTVAPEAPGAIAAIAALHQRGIVVSVGHSTASYDDAEAAIAAGATLATHLFNGMGPLHHREPGIVGAALTDPRVAASLIADLVHVHPAALALAFAAKGAANVVLVTDSVAATAGRVGAVRFDAGDGAPRLADGTLAGSQLTMDRAVRNVVTAAGIPLADALVAASSTPARVLDLTDRGVLEPGRRADVVALDADLAVAQVWIGGEPVYGQER